MLLLLFLYYSYENWWKQIVKFHNIKKEKPQTVLVFVCVVAVKVVLVPEGHVMTVAFAIGLSIQELKYHLASELRVPSEVLQISLDGTVSLSLTTITGVENNCDTW